MTLEIRVCGQHSALDRGQQGAKPPALLVTPTWLIQLESLRLSLMGL